MQMLGYTVEETREVFSWLLLGRTGILWGITSSSLFQLPDSDCWFSLLQLSHSAHFCDLQNNVSWSSRSFDNLNHTKILCLIYLCLLLTLLSNYVQELVSTLNIISSRSCSSILSGLLFTNIATEKYCFFQRLEHTLNKKLLKNDWK